MNKSDTIDYNNEMSSGRSRQTDRERADSKREEKVRKRNRGEMISSPRLNETQEAED